MTPPPSPIFFSQKCHGVIWFRGGVKMSPIWLDIFITKQAFFDLTEVRKKLLCAEVTSWSDLHIKPLSLTILAIEFDQVKKHTQYFTLATGLFRPW